MHRFVAAAALCLVAAPSLAQMVTISPEQIGQIFCISRLGNDMAPVEGLLTADLTATIAEAEAKNDAIQKAHPDEKPPLGDGIPWQNYPDQADDCRASTLQTTSTTVLVSINYTFKAAPEANFTDALRIEQVDDPGSDGKVWRIDNVEYDIGSDLRSVLETAFQN